MNSIQTKTLNRLAHHAAALVAYAKTDTDFADLLYAHVQRILDEKQPTAFVTPSKYLCPQNLEEAENRTVWLLQEITVHKSKKTSEAQAILVTWAKNYESPQDIVLGIVGVAIIGPTLGMIKKKKKRKSHMRVFINQSETKNRKNHMLDIALEVSTGLLGNELAAVNGQAYRLDPELADWLFTEHDTITKTISNTKLQELVLDLQTESLPHYVLKTNDVITAVAVAPAVNENFLHN